MDAVGHISIGIDGAPIKIDEDNLHALMSEIVTSMDAACGVPAHMLGDGSTHRPLRCNDRVVFCNDPTIDIDESEPDPHDVVVTQRARNL